MISKNYAELHAVSNFTFLRGASHPEELVERAGALNYGALALTDECSMAGMVRAHVKAAEIGLQLIIGSEFTLSDGLRLVLLAGDIEAYAALCGLITLGRRRAGKGSYALNREDIESLRPGCLGLLLSRAAQPGIVDDPQTLDREARWFRDVFQDNGWLSLEYHRDGLDGKRLEYLRAAAKSCNLPIVASGNVHLHDPGRRPPFVLASPSAKPGHRCTPTASGICSRSRNCAVCFPRTVCAKPSQWPSAAGSTSANCATSTPGNTCRAAAPPISIFGG